MILDTQRLRLREYSMTDLRAFLKAMNSPSIAMARDDRRELGFLDAFSIINHYQQHRLLAPRRNYSLVVELKEKNQFAGGVCLQGIKPNDRTCSIGYWVCEGYRRQGIAKEATKAMIDFAFDELGLEVICLETDWSNKASASLASSLGFEFIGENISIPVSDSHSRRRIKAYSLKREAATRKMHQQEQYQEASA